MLAKMKSKLSVPEVKAAVYILGGILSILLFIFMIVNFTDFTILMTIIGFIIFLLYKLWQTIVLEIKKNERRKEIRR